MLVRSLDISFSVVPVDLLPLLCSVGLAMLVSISSGSDSPGSARLKSNFRAIFPVCVLVAFEGLLGDFSTDFGGDVGCRDVLRIRKAGEFKFVLVGDFERLAIDLLGERSPSLRLLKAVSTSRAEPLLLVSGLS